MRVLLLHGLWMPGLSMWPLARRLRAAGFATEVAAYRGALAGPARMLPALARRMHAADAVVAHSLGGLMALEALHCEPGLPVRRVLCLGSPLRGSAAARGVLGRRPLAWSLGRSAGLLCRGCGSWDGAAEVAAIAGDLPVGLGAWMTRFDGPHDGAVAVAETRLPGLSDHRVIHASHSGLLLAPSVATLAAAFLHTGRFPSTPAGVAGSV